MLTMFVLLVGIVRRGSKTIADQQRALRETVTTQAALHEHNARLHQRIRQAAGRTTTLNEQALRRISADLHDGPAQALAFALLRLDAVVEEDARAAQRSDCATVRIAVQDALKEIRAISAGLRSPELAGLPLSEIARRAVQDHERRSGSREPVCHDNQPEAAPLAIKNALFRTLQEALSNAARHGGGAQVAARLWIDAGRLHLEITDRGPGLSAAGRNGSGLGLAGMRERAELLGGEFAISSTPGEGTHVVVWWPMDQLDEA
jgi:signal transduction histidine kinase